jgi:hypothetical protein
MAKTKVKGHRRADGTKVKGYTRYDGKKVSGHKITKRAGKYKEALEKSRTSKSGHKSWRDRQKEKKPGLWSNYWASQDRKKRKKR